MGKGAKWAFLMCSLCLLTGFAVFELYLWIERDEWADETNAVQKAYEQSILYSAQKAVPFVGENPYMVVFGKDKLEKEMLVWVGEKGVHAEYAADGISMQEAAVKVTARDPGNKVIRTAAGKWLNEYAWEVFYKKTEDGATRYFYDFYRFSDGKYLDTYNLSLK